MPLKLNVGLSKKVGLPNYSSLGASCHVELELENGVLEHDLERFHGQVQSAYVACSQAVHDELVRQQASNGTGSEGLSTGDSSAPRTPSTNGQGAEQPASPRQLSFLRQLAGQIRGLGLKNLDVLVDRVYYKPAAELSSREASRLIDRLKEVRSGATTLESLLEEMPHGQ